MARTLSDVEKALGADVLAARESDADRDAAALARVLELVRGGASRSAAVREVVPDRPVSSMLRRLREYEAHGRDVLVSKRFPPPPPRKISPEVMIGLRTLAKSDPTAGSEVLAQRLSTAFDISVKPSAVQDALHELGLARPRGRPWWRTSGGTSAATEEAPVAPVVTPLALAGAELLKAIDEDVGAVAALTRALGERLDALPEREGEPLDDREHRDENGRFLPSYNEPEPRLAPELGDRFNSVEERRGAKDLGAMRVVAESERTRRRKILGLVLLPCVVRSSRWSELQHWRGEHLDELVGHAYQPATLDKFLRELKLGGCSAALREAVASFWLGEEGTPADKATGAVVLYADASTKPLWTHHWTRSAKVSKTGRIQPATTTMTLHSGAGTPLLYRSYSGQASLPAEIHGFLAEYERHAGPGTVRRVIVMDREAHTVSLFKALTPNWGFVIPLRSQVVGPSAKFEDAGAWGPYGERGDEVCNAQLSLNDSRPGEDPLRIRVVGRRRHRTGKVAWFATNVPVDEFSAADVIRLYFDRWPAQEHVYRDGSGAVGLDVHHGYGKRKVDNVAVIDRQDKLLGQIQRLEAHIARRRAALEEARQEHAGFQDAFDTRLPIVRREREEFDGAMARNAVTDAMREGHRILRLWEGWIETTRANLDQWAKDKASAREIIAEEEAARDRKRADVERLSAHRQIFTVDVELDEIMTAFKFTFMNLCAVLMTTWLGVNMEIETLIESVLTLPGERVTTATTETVRIYRQPRDPRAMAAVERACVALTARGIRRDDRTLAFELTDPPGRNKPPPVARKRRRDPSGP